MAAAPTDMSVSHDTAFLLLDALVDKQKISDFRANELKSAYSSLHEFLLSIYEKEQRVFRQAGALKAESDSQREKLERISTQVFEYETTKSKIGHELATMEHDMRLAEEALQNRSLEVKELQIARDSVERQVQKASREKEDLLAPKVSRLKETIAEHKTELADREKEAKERVAEKAAILAQIKSETEHVQSLTVTRQDAVRALHKVKDDPANIKQQADTYEAAVGNMDRDCERVRKEMEGLAAAVDEEQRDHQRLEDQLVHLHVQIDKHHQAKAQKDKVLADMHSTLAQLKDNYHETLDDQVSLDRELKLLEQSLRQATDKLSKRTREKDAVVKQVKQTELLLSAARSALPMVHQQEAELESQLKTLEAENKRERARVELMRSDVDVRIHHFMHHESFEKGQEARLREEEAKIGTLTEERERLKRVAQDERKHLATTTAQREKAAFQESRNLSKVRSIREHLVMQELEISDAQKRVQEVTVKLQECQSLYEKVKSDRNKFVNLIQDATQAEAEMKEKLRILQNEEEILGSESATKSKALQNAQLRYQTAFTTRDSLRSEVNKMMFEYRKQQEQVDQQISAIEKLNSIINATEEELLRLKRAFELAVEDRNYTGIQLIDRNDELCILYEKANIQESILRNGNIELRDREEERSVLTLEEKALLREIEHLTAHVPAAPSLEGEVVTLQTQLLAERERVEQLSIDLESPENEARWRKLRGKDPAPDDLRAKAETLESRLNDKEEQLLEKQLVLEEIRTLTERLKKESISGRQSTLHIAQQVNDFQAKIRDVTRKMMAAVSELSLYQYNVMRLEQEKEEKAAMHETAMARREQGQAPTDEIEQSWLREQRQRLQLRKERQRRKQEQMEEEMAAVLGTRTTAEPRPNAYRDEMGLPRPYLMPPMAPAIPSAQMRHIRKPVVRPVDI